MGKADPRFTSIGHVLFTWKPLMQCSPAARWLWLSCYAGASAKRALPGLFPGGEYAMAEASQMEIEEVRNALAELKKARLVIYDHENRLLRYLELPDAHDRAYSLPTLRGWWTKFRSYPECPQRDLHLEKLKWLLDQGETNDSMRKQWNATFGTLSVPSNPSLFAPADLSDTGTAVQPGLFGSKDVEPTFHHLEPDGDPLTYPLPHPLPHPPAGGTDQDQDQDRDPEQDQDQVLPSGPDPGSAPELRSPPSNVIPFVMPPPLDERDRLRAKLVQEIGYDHAMRFSRVRTAIGSTAWGPHVNDTHEELRTLVRSFPSLDDAKHRLTHVLAVREAEAIKENTLKYFGGQMWKRHNFDNALAREVADVDGSREQTRSPTGREATGVSAIMEMLSEDQDDEQEGKATLR